MAPLKTPPAGSGREDIGRHTRFHEFNRGVLRYIDEDAQRIRLRHPIERRRGRSAAGRDQIADVDLALGDGAVERRHDLLELRERGVLIDFGFIERDLGIGRKQACVRAFVVGLLRLAFLLRYHAFGRVAPALVGGLAEFSFRLARGDLSFGGLQLRAGGAELGIEFGSLDERQNLAFFHMIADVDHPFRDVAADARVNRGFVPGRGLPRQYQVLTDRGRLCGDDIDGRRGGVGGIGALSQGVRFDQAKHHHHAETKQQDAAGDTRADLQGPAGTRFEFDGAPACLGTRGVVRQFGGRRAPVRMGVGRKQFRVMRVHWLYLWHSKQLQRPADGAATGTSWERKSEWRRWRTTSRR